MTALVSALSSIPVRRDVAMTGEITLRGRVLPIGGLKEKTMAAYTAGVKTVLIPYDNLANLEDIDPVAKEAIHFIPCKTADDVLAAALADISSPAVEISVSENIEGKVSDSFEVHIPSVPNDGSLPATQRCKE